MSKSYTFSIEGCTPDEIPIRRLSKYLDNLATIMRYSRGVRLQGIAKGSAQFPLKILDGYEQPVANHIIRLKRGEGNKTAIKAVKKINSLLSEDDAKGYLWDEAHKIEPLLHFPGRVVEQNQIIEPFDQKGSLDGVLCRIGGTGEKVQIQLVNGELRYTGIETDRETARKLAKKMYQFLRIFGTGCWWRDGEGNWSLKKFLIDDFTVLGDDSLQDVVKELRAVKGYAWEEMEDPYGTLKALR